MNAVNLPQTQVIPVSFEQFKQESESRITSLFGNIFPATSEAEQANYDLTLRAIYNLSSGSTEVQFNSLPGLSNETQAKLFIRLVETLQNPSTGEVSATNLNHIVQFTEQGGLDFPKFTHILRDQDTLELKSVYLAMAKAEVLSGHGLSLKFLRDIMRDCHLNTRREELKFINSVIGCFNYEEDVDKLAAFFKEIVDTFQLSSNELIELAKHLINERPACLYASGIIPLIKDEDVRFKLAQFFATNKPSVMDDGDFFQLDLSEQHEFEILKLLMDKKGDIATFTMISTLLLHNPNYFNREKLIGFIDEAFAKDPRCLYVWPHENYKLLPSHILISLAKRGHVIAFETISRAGEKPQEFDDPKFISEALIASWDSLPIPNSLAQDAQVIAIRKILVALKNFSILNRQEVLQASRFIPQLYSVLPETFRNDPAFIELALPLVEQGDKVVWEALSSEIRNTPKHALKAIQNNLKIFLTLSDELKNNEEILRHIKTKALQGYREALETLGFSEKLLPTLLKEHDLASALIKYDVNIYSKLPDSLKKDREFIQIVLEKVMEGVYDKWLLLPKEEQLNHENICRVLKKYPEFYISSAMSLSKLYQKDVLGALFYVSPQVVDEFVDKSGFEWVKAAVQFATTVLEADGYIKVKDGVEVGNPQKRVVDIVKQLPMELQMVYANRTVGLTEDKISAKDVEWALRYVLFKFSQQKNVA